MFGLFNSLFGNASNPEVEQVIRSAYLVDVRTPAEYASGHVPGSVNIPLDQLQNKISELKNKEPIVVFCQSGNRSSMAKQILEQHGIQKVYNGGSWMQVHAMLHK
jgi:rhodanese-related sulfurtransferase